MRKVLTIIALCFGALLSGCVALQHLPNKPQATPQSFALIGDNPYGADSLPDFAALLAAINRDPDIRFVLHTGDIKAGNESCDDRLLRQRWSLLKQFRTPVAFTPGDNDWTDCHRASNGGFLPTERLQALRSIFFGRDTAHFPTQLDQSVDPRHAEYTENRLWSFAGTLIATVHVVGSRNDLAPWSLADPPDSDTQPRPNRLAEFAAREAAALDWLHRIFTEASVRKASAVFIAMHGDPNFDQPADSPERRGYNRCLEFLVRATVQFGGPVVLAHGDTHYFRVDKPLLAPPNRTGLPRVDNLTRVENFGHPHPHWVKVTVDPDYPEVFRFDAMPLQLRREQAEHSESNRRQGM